MDRDAVIRQLKKEGNVRVAFHNKPNTSWIYDTIETMDCIMEYNHRDVLDNEVVLDYDEDDIEQNAYWSGKVAVRMKKLGLKFSTWRTGGKGVHQHLFFKGLNKLADIRLMKNILADYCVGDIEVKVDRQLMGKHLVRMEYGHHEKSHKQQAIKEPVDCKNHFVENEIPQECFEKYKQQIVRYALRRLQYKHSGVKPQYKTPECVKYISSDEYGQIQDGGKRGMFVMASYYRNLPDEELASLLKRYNDYNLKEPLNRLQIIATVKSVRKNKGRPVGCAYRHELLRSLGKEDVARRCEQMRDAKLNEATNNETQSTKNT